MQASDSFGQDALDRIFGLVLDRIITEKGASYNQTVS